MSCAPPVRLVQGSRGVWIAYQVFDRDEDGAPVPVDLTLAASPPGYAVAFFKRPDRSIIQRPVAVQVPEVDGEAAYQTEEGFLDQLGRWVTMLEVFLPGTGLGRGTFHSHLIEFEVLPAIRPFSGRGDEPSEAVEIAVEVPAVLLSS